MSAVVAVLFGLAAALSGLPADAGVMTPGADLSKGLEECRTTSEVPSVPYLQNKMQNGIDNISEDKTTAQNAVAGQGLSITVEVLVCWLVFGERIDLRVLNEERLKIPI